MQKVAPEEKTGEEETKEDGHKKKKKKHKKKNKEKEKELKKKMKNKNREVSGRCSELPFYFLFFSSLLFSCFCDLHLLFH